MAKEIGSNVGLLHDCWHWYTSGGTVEEILTLSPQDIIYVHVNDAPANVDRDAQMDNIRALPGETGVIDIVGYLNALKTIGYTGCVTPEPFKSSLNDLPTDTDRLQLVGESMNLIFLRAGI